MKKFISILFLLIISKLIYSQKVEKEIGNIIEGKYVITTESNTIKKMLNHHLINIGINKEIASIEIKKLKMRNKLSEYYLLYATNTSNTVKVAINLELRKNTFYAIMMKNTFENICVCNGCNDGCTPQRTKEKNDNAWSCSSCIESKNNSKCSKSITVNTP